MVCTRTSLKSPLTTSRYRSRPGELRSTLPGVPCSFEPKLFTITSPTGMMNKNESQASAGPASANWGARSGTLLGGGPADVASADVTSTAGLGLDLAVDVDQA